MIRFRNLLAGALLGTVAMFAAHDANAIVIDASNSGVAQYDLSPYSAAATFTCFNVGFGAGDLFEGIESFGWAIRDTSDAIITSGSFTWDNSPPLSTFSCCNDGLNPFIPQIGSVLITSLSGSFDMTHIDMILTTDTQGVSEFPLNLVSVPAAATSAVPLPTALPLFGTGLAIMGFIGWRRKRFR